MKKQKKQTPEPYMLQSNQNNAAITNDGICYTLTASMGMGGGYVPMIVVKNKTEGHEDIDGKEILRVARGR